MIIKQANLEQKQQQPKENTTPQENPPRKKHQ